jgi:hypothetical protein
VNPSESPRIARAFGVANLIAAAVALFGVFVALPARWWPVDAGALVVGALLAASGVGLVAKKAWADRAARWAAAAVLAMGLAFVAILAVTASYLSGIYGPVGRGGAVILVLVAALALPYLVVLPLAQLVWLGPRVKKSAKPEGREAT